MLRGALWWGNATPDVAAQNLRFPLCARAAQDEVADPEQDGCSLKLLVVFVRRAVVVVMLLMMTMMMMIYKKQFVVHAAVDDDDDNDGDEEEDDDLFATETACPADPKSPRGRLQVQDGNTGVW